MLKELVEHFEKFMSLAGNVETIVQPDDLKILCKAARLLIEIHTECDNGNLNGVNLDWMVKADDLIIGRDS